ncbi:MAG: PBP1A family penicillin-binding protein [Eubacteriales bacterium]|nr:PBP1A family penicillin-binding protein [Eubacteriales bacterium]
MRDFFRDIWFNITEWWRHFCRWLRDLFQRDTGASSTPANNEQIEHTHTIAVRREKRSTETEAFDGGETRTFSAEETRNAARQAQHRSRERQEEPLFCERTRPRPFVLAVLFATVKLLCVAVVLVGFTGLGAAVGIAKAYIDTTPTLDRAQLTKSDRTSFLYDKNSRLITSIADVEYRDWVDIENIPELLQNAFIAVEDVRFYKHDGVDVKRLFSAALEVLGNNDSSGGSTITQQLIKNKVVGSERNYRRKIQEAYLALELEKEIDKKQILEAYLNDIHLGESNYGVKTAAMDYFGKELDQLTVRECAMLAGLTQNPYRYNPRKNKYQREATYWTQSQNRTDKVLGAMYEAGFITQEQYAAALKEDVYIVEVSAQKQLYDMPYFVEYAIRDVVTHMLTQRGLSDTSTNRSMLENELRTGGYHIYTTVDPKVQNTVQNTLAGWEAYPTLADPANAVVTEKNADGSVIETVEPQASAVVLDYHTGELRAVVGGRNTPTIRKGLNRAYQSYMEVGSSIKPLAVYGPALELGLSPASIIDNLPIAIEGWGGEKGYPYIGAEKWIGPITLRRGVVSSLNVAAARTLFKSVTPEVAADYLYKLGADPSKVNVDGPGLALGTSGLTTIQMAAAYGAIANGGVYQEPLSFTRVVDSAGKVIIDADEIRQNRQVFQTSTAYMLVDILKNAVASGTGTKAKIEGMTVAGKTGTNSDYSSVYFAGMTPYYTATVWIGHDSPAKVLKSGSSGGDYAAPLWQAFMSKIHEGLADREIIDESPADLGLVRKTVCSVTGLLATDACRADTAGHTPVSDWFLEDNAPTTYCDAHAAVAVCSASGQIATTNCPETSITAGSVVLIRPSSVYYSLSDELLAKAIPNYVRTELTLEQYKQGLEASQNLCTVHNNGMFGTTDGTEQPGVTLPPDTAGNTGEQLP